MTIVLWLFLSPFMAVGLAMLVKLIASMCGRCEVRVRDGMVEVFSGVGPWGRRRTFDAQAVRRVSIEQLPWPRVRTRTSARASILIEAGRTLRFGASLPAERRRFVADVLAGLLTG